MISHVAVALAGVGVTHYMVSCLIRISASRGLLIDRPNQRSSHSRPTPRGGGIAIVTVVLLGIVLFWRPDGVVRWGAIGGYAVGAGLVAGVGWLDDIRSLPTLTRFVVHLFAALMVIGLVGYWQALEIPMLGRLGLGILGVPLSIIWIAASTNIYNFMDGIDGLAASQAIIASLGWLVLGVLGGHDLIVWISLLLISGALGFLLHNWAPARVFMGDVASGFLGFAFASLAILGSRYDLRYGIAGVLFLWPFLFDGAYTILRRLRARENVLTAHRSHIYQRLVASGLSHDQVTILYASSAFLCVLSAWIWIFAPGASWVPIGATVITAIGLLWLVRVREAVHATVET